MARERENCERGGPKWSGADVCREALKTAKWRRIDQSGRKRMCLDCTCALSRARTHTHAHTRISRGGAKMKFSRPLFLQQIQLLEALVQRAVTSLMVRLERSDGQETVNKRTWLPRGGGKVGGAGGVGGQVPGTKTIRAVGDR